ncbi:hypothetical protein HO133_002270 [Letharia lupina]|uniref:Uncharacterized protein n=1 Tax=Letharia lupina TaxID=560253 RepID=A0A8H6CD49_9LECA|nr:uncharacterized protein HO133_002270 [Letharia lupina]KAF6221415.1 hypothetical protein HO133_002270 [Letharia lupina]
MKPSEDDKQSVEAVVQECTLSFGKSESCPSAGIGSDEAEESDEDMGFGLFDTPPPREITPPEGCHSRFFSHYSRERGGSPTKENGRGRGGRRTTPPSQSRETATRSAGSPAQSASLAQFLLVRLFAFTTSDMSNPSDRQLHLLAVPMVCSVQWHRLVRPLSLVQRRSKNVLRPLAPPKEITDIEKVISIIELQDFEGSWTEATQLTSTMGIKEKILCTKMESYWITWVVVAFLEQKMGKERETWDLVICKAKTWLKGNFFRTEVLEAEARQVIQQWN